MNPISRSVYDLLRVVVVEDGLGECVGTCEEHDRLDDTVGGQGADEVALPRGLIELSTCPRNESVLHARVTQLGRTAMACFEASQPGLVPT